MTTLQSRPSSTKEEQPYVDPVGARHTGRWLAIVLAVWLVGWALLKGNNTLALAPRVAVNFQLF